VEDLNAQTYRQCCHGQASYLYDRVTGSRFDASSTQASSWKANGFTLATLAHVK